MVEGLGVSLSLSLLLCLGTRKVSAAAPSPLPSPLSPPRLSAPPSGPRYLDQSKMEFCPLCGLMLQIETARSGRPLSLACPVCPYFCVPTAKITKVVPVVKKEIDPIFSGTDAMPLQKAINTTCPNCRNTDVSFWEMQIRSADEPATLFFRCCNNNCGHQWREG
ncbi:DNA-directed RNA polymerase subunit [Rhynchospora pubera]|uniref:DNA-directed RNA polymerase III subunit RPC10 n=2 Tax=Rhynchospora pubera TaxID=906938 RepID=A0AAV8DBZ2_9POAL|nr:DNA-directed RNA polymerase subunit [Rhynchospora pubera]